METLKKFPRQTFIQQQSFHCTGRDKFYEVFWSAIGRTGWKLSLAQWNVVWYPGIMLVKDCVIHTHWDAEQHHSNLSVSFTMPIIYVFFSPLQNILPDILFAFPLPIHPIFFKTALVFGFNSKELHFILHFPWTLCPHVILTNTRKFWSALKYSSGWCALQACLP